MFKHILVPTDGSELSLSTAKRAVKFAKEAKAKITFFYAKPDYPITYYAEGMVLTDPQEFNASMEAQAQKILGQVVGDAKAAGVECEAITSTHSSPYEAIIEAAKNSQCDLIFMASHGRSGLSGLILGSETNKVLTHSKIPVLVYR